MGGISQALSTLPCTSLHSIGLQKFDTLAISGPCGAFSCVRRFLQNSRGLPCSISRSCLVSPFSRTSKNLKYATCVIWKIRLSWRRCRRGLTKMHARISPRGCDLAEGRRIGDPGDTRLLLLKYVLNIVCACGFSHA
jgi:hypothetical protein